MGFLDGSKGIGAWICVILSPSHHMIFSLLDPGSGTSKIHRDACYAAMFKSSQTLLPQ